MKASCAQVLVAFGSCIENANIDVQTVCKYLYHHDYYLPINDTKGDDECSMSSTANSTYESSRTPLTKQGFLLQNHTGKIMNIFCLVERL